MRRFQHFLHAGRLELEDGGGVRIAEDLVGSLVVKRNLTDIDDIAGGILMLFCAISIMVRLRRPKSRISPNPSSTSPLSYMDTGEADSSA